MHDPGKHRRLLARRSPRTRSVLLAAGVLVVAGSPFAVAGTGDVLREGVKNGNTTKETEIVGKFNYKSPKGGYVTRQSNIQTGNNAGGSAIYGCRTQDKANPVPCLRANNLSTGQAFQFNTITGPTAGTINAGAGGDTKKPFTTNATGVATGLNADRLDSLNAAQIIASARLKMDLDADTLDGLNSTAFVKTADRVLAYATVADTGTVDAARSRGITQANVDPDTQAGIVCFTDLPFTPKNVMVTAQGVFDGGQNDVIATTFVSLGTVSTGDCAGKLQVRTFDVSSAALADRPFLIWFAE